MIIGKEITKTYVGDPILENISFKIGDGRKIALVGRNGCGKTTLFKLITGDEDMTAGNIDLTNERVGYIPQELPFPDLLVGELLEQKLENAWEEYKIDALVQRLKYEKYDPYQKISTLSEGQKMKLKLIEVFLEDPTILLIDEPTNHLDIEGIMWFEQYIKSLQMSVVMISHDREFLNNTVDEIWEIEDKNLYQFVGDYDNYREQKLKLINKWDAEYALFIKRKQKLEKLLESARKIKDGKARGRAVESAKKRIRREVEENTAEKYEVKKISTVEFETDFTAQKLMVMFDGVKKAYGDKVVFGDMSFEVRAGEKIWLFGPNGAGKSTLVKLIVGDEDPNEGNIRIGNNMKIGYFAQKQTFLDYEKTLLEAFMEETKCPYGKTFGFLQKFLFDKDMIQKKIKFLSPGQRARYAFALFAYSDYDLLILDEPTNHLDIETKEVIEKSLSLFKGTLLLVSHDRYFVESVGINKRLNLREGRLEWF